MNGDAPSPSGAEPSSPAHHQPDSVLAAILAEAELHGRSATLDMWLSDARRRLDEFRRQRPGERRLRAADRIEAAFLAAADLVAHVRPPAPAPDRAAGGSGRPWLSQIVPQRPSPFGRTPDAFR